MEAGNVDLTQGRTIPWLQDDADTNLWGLWQVRYRDVVILDVNGSYFDTFNLSDHDLSNAESSAAFLDLLAAAGG